MKDAFLTGKNIYLRALNKEDALGEYVNWFNDAEVCKYNSHHIFPYTKEKAAEYIIFVNSSNKNLVLAIIDKQNNKHIGNISLQNICYMANSAEFAIIVGNKDSWGKGYSKEASKLIINHGFLELNLNRIYCGTSIENVPMQKLALYLGMKEEGKRRQAIYKNGKYLDIIEYGILREEYKLEG